MSKSIKISDEDYYLVKMISDNESWKFIKTLSKAINFFAKAKRLTAWDKLPKSEQEKIKNKAKNLVDKR